MKKIYVVSLTEAERTYLLEFTKKGENRPRKVTRAHILLLADEGKIDDTVAEMLHIGRATVERIRKKFVEGGIEFALNERPRKGKDPKLNGKAEAYLTAIACSDPPQGRKRWTMQLLADRLVEAGIVDEISDETVRRVLKKTTSNPGRSSSGVSHV